MYFPIFFLPLFSSSFSNAGILCDGWLWAFSSRFLELRPDWLELTSCERQMTMTQGLWRLSPREFRASALYYEIPLHFPIFILWFRQKSLCIESSWLCEDAVLGKPMKHGLHKSGKLEMSAVVFHNSHSPAMSLIYLYWRYRISLESIRLCHCTTDFGLCRTKLTRYISLGVAYQLNTHQRWRGKFHLIRVWPIRQKFQSHSYDCKTIRASQRRHFQSDLYLVPSVCSYNYPESKLYCTVYIKLRVQDISNYAGNNYVRVYFLDRPLGDIWALHL